MNDKPNPTAASESERLGPLASGLAHDLNNILVPTLGAAQMLRKRVAGDPAAVELVELIHRNAQRGAELMERLMALGASAAGQVLLDPAQLLADVAQLAKQTFPPQITVESRPGAELWRIRGEAPKLFEALMNLCLNAREAMPSGGQLMLQAENVQADEAFAAAHSSARPGRYVVFTVKDSGMGIRPEVRPNLFKRFFSTKPAGQGAGVGLANAQNIAQAHGGFILIESEPGWGTTVRVYVAAASETAVPAARAGDSVILPASGKGEGVLLVDDDTGVRTMCKNTLEQFGYRVFTAGDGDAAVATFAEVHDRIQIVITDLSMPTLNGDSVVAAVKRLKPAVRVIVSSGFLDQNRCRELRALGCNAFLNKPFTIAQLLRVLHETLRGHEGG